MSSCGNPVTDGEALMQEKSRFDKSSICIKCKTERGNIVVRHTVYCKTCFFPLVTTKFRRCLDPHINAVTDVSRRSALKARGDLLVGFSDTSGGVDKNGRKGGKAHPKYKRVWAKAYVCYVEVCAAFTEGHVRERSEDIRNAVEKAGDFDFVLARLEDAFDSKWWTKISGSCISKTFGIDLNNEALPLLPDYHSIELSNGVEEPAKLLRAYLASLPTPTAVQSAIATFTRLVLVHTARYLQCSHLALGASLTSMSISLIGSIAQGGGFNVPDESFEEWQDNSFDSPGSQEIHTEKKREKDNVRIVRPLRDVGMKECAAWSWWKGLHIVGREVLPRPSVKQTIGGLTKQFIVGLERDYPSTVSTIARTCAKLAPRDESSGRCALCERPFPDGISKWKSRISIRSLNDLRFSQRGDIFSSPTAPPEFAAFAQRLCYACHTLLTSKSSRSSVPLTSSSVRLPMWTNEHLLRNGETDEVRNTIAMGREEMRNAVSEFLLQE